MFLVLAVVAWCVLGNTPDRIFWASGSSARVCKIIVPSHCLIPIGDRGRGHVYVRAKCKRAPEWTVLH